MLRKKKTIDSNQKTCVRTLFNFFKSHFSYYKIGIVKMSIKIISFQ